MCLAGLAAETLVLGELSNGAGVGPTSDLAQATMLAAQMEFNWSFGESGIAWHEVKPSSLHALPVSKQRRIEVHLHAADAAVRTLLKQICGQLNNTPRKCLGWKTPAEVFREKMMEKMGRSPYPQRQ
jgi:cell division protease FtsH